MAVAKANTTTTAQMSSVTAREVDFVTRFGANWEALRNILGIMRPIRKAPGTVLRSYTASSVNGLQGGKTVKEGELIPLTQMQVIEARKGDVEIAKYAKRVTIEAVNKYGAEVAVQKTDEAFLAELQNSVMNDFYTFLGTGSLAGTSKNIQKALAVAKGAVLNKFMGMNKTVTDVVGFVNVNALYEYLGDAAITVQTAFGIQYIKDFLGYSTIFLLPDNQLAKTKVIACPVENIDLYYIDPADSDFAKLGLDYTVEGETNLIGFHVEGSYDTASGDAYALMGMKLWAEYLDGICVMTIGSTEAAPTVSAS